MTIFLSREGKVFAAACMVYIVHACFCWYIRSCFVILLIVMQYAIGYSEMFLPELILIGK